MMDINMMDINDDEDAVLGLALGSKNYPVQLRLNNSSGAGVNANSRVDMAFAASDPLSELVWSPHSGLILKCADSSLGDNKPLLTRNMEPSAKDLSTSPSNRSKGSGDNKVIDEEKLAMPQPMLDGDRKIVVEDTLFRSCGGSSSHELEAGHGYCDADKREEEGGTKDNRDEDLSGSQNVQIADVAESSKRNAEKDILVEKIHQNKVETAINLELSRKSSEALLNLQFRPEPDDEVTSASREMNKNKMALMKQESYAENDFKQLAAEGGYYLHETRFLREASLPFHKCLTDSRACLCLDKGKERALSEGDIHGRSSNDEDDSHESVESCNSAGLFSKGIKRRSCDQEELIGSKRMKSDSSFMKWILNMVKGLPDSNNDKSSSVTLTLTRSNDDCGYNDRENNVCNKMDDCESPNMGFQSLFRSLYSRNTKMSEVPKGNSSKEITVADKKSLEYLPQSCHNDIGNSCKQIVLANKEVHAPTSKSVLGVCERPSVENKAWDLPVCYRAKEEGSSSDSLYKQVNSTRENKSLDVPGKSNPHAHLWITRFCTQTPRLENCNRITEEARQRSIACPNVSLDSAENQLHVSEQHTSMNESAHKSNRHSEKLRNSEAMASVFAKRLDALRHITHPSGKSKLSTCTVICFFCGGSGHDLHKCPELTETELEDLLVKISSFNKVEESRRLCMRCFQFDHWAASCPFRLSHKDRQKEQNLDIGKPCLGSSRKGLLTSHEYKRSTATTSETDLKDKQNFPLCNFGNVIMPEELFCAIRKLRLSRSDILRWMSSTVSLSCLEGFFLRLRLGKLEAGLQGTRYHVACITGSTMENNGSNSKKCILVDVGGIKSSVESQYVSNHDFLEDEIKAWWSRIMKTGGKIPSLDELNSKFQHKKCLGF